MKNRTFAAYLDETDSLYKPDLAAMLQDEDDTLEVPAKKQKTSVTQNQDQKLKKKLTEKQASKENCKGSDARIQLLAQLQSALTGPGTASSTSADAPNEIDVKESSED